MRIENVLLYSMFQVASVDKDQMYAALRIMGKKELKPAFRQNWSENNPTYCYCYVIAEWVYYYSSPYSTIPYKLQVPNDPGLHRFLRWPTGIVIDLSADQFDNYEEVDYTKGKVCYFMQSGGKGPSRRARMLANLMGTMNVIR